LRQPMFASTANATQVTRTEENRFITDIVYHVR
jgi:hypothetical protein